MLSTSSLRFAWLRPFACDCDPSDRGRGAGGPADAVACALAGLRAGSMRDAILRSSVARFLRAGIDTRRVPACVYETDDWTDSFALSPNGKIMVIYHQWCLSERLYALRRDDVHGTWRRAAYYGSGTRLLKRHNMCVPQLVVQNDGRVFIPGDCGRRIFVLAQEPMFVLRAALRHPVFNGKRCFVDNLCVNDETLAACSRNTRKRAVSLVTYDARTLECTGCVRLAQLRSCSVMCWLSGDSARVAIADFLDKSVKMFDVATGHLLRRLSLDIWADDHVHYLDLAPSGVLAAASTQQLVLYSYEEDSVEVLQELPCIDMCRGIQFNNNALYVAYNRKCPDRTNLTRADFRRKENSLVIAAIPYT